ncbi:hypothetical protein AVDCRST_MAG92-3449 [uncultured Coleofasciculus sp.]|uniref:Uncharacterized protein n=1 Tax=uncultured Coleofasciculus sp. TaxID=1267456 RepID=A0A6J4JJT3_9CYAN|nr:hypothetical protein AVDCRST_MAG92-3449 [uncultured Coleofasciculus sp.]
MGRTTELISRNFRVLEHFLVVNCFSGYFRLRIWVKTAKFLSFSITDISSL